MFQDNELRTQIQMECEKRNRNMSKFQRTTHAWKPLWNHKRGWHPELRHA